VIRKLLIHFTHDFLDKNPTGINTASQNQGNRNHWAVMLSFAKRKVASFAEILLGILCKCLHPLQLPLMHHLLQYRSLITQTKRRSVLIVNPSKGDRK